MSSSKIEELNNDHTNNDKKQPLQSMNIVLFEKDRVTELNTPIEFDFNPDDKSYTVHFDQKPDNAAYISLIYKPAQNKDESLVPYTHLYNGNETKEIISWEDGQNRVCQAPFEIPMSLTLKSELGENYKIQIAHPDNQVLIKNENVEEKNVELGETESIIKNNNLPQNQNVESNILNKNKIKSVELYLYKDRLNPLEKDSLITKFNPDKKTYEINLTEEQAKHANFLSLRSVAAEGVDVSFANKKGEKGIYWKEEPKVFNGQFELSFDEDGENKNSTQVFNILVKEQGEKVDEYKLCVNTPTQIDNAKILKNDMNGRFEETKVQNLDVENHGNTNKETQQEIEFNNDVDKLKKQFLEQNGNKEFPAIKKLDNKTFLIHCPKEQSIHNYGFKIDPDVEYELKQKTGEKENYLLSIKPETIKDKTNDLVSINIHLKSDPTRQNENVYAFKLKNTLENEIKHFPTAEEALKLWIIKEKLYSTGANSNIIYKYAYQLLQQREAEAKKLLNVQKEQVAINDDNKFLAANSEEDLNNNLNKVVNSKEFETIKAGNEVITQHKFEVSPSTKSEDKNSIKNENLLTTQPINNADQQSNLTSHHHSAPITQMSAPAPVYSTAPYPYYSPVTYPYTNYTAYYPGYLPNNTTLYSGKSQNGKTFTAHTINGLDALKNSIKGLTDGKSQITIMRLHEPDTYKTGQKALLVGTFLMAFICLVLGYGKSGPFY